MKKLLLSILLLLVSLCSLAQKAPKAVLKASQSMVSLLAYSNGKLLAGGTVFFVGGEGDLVAPASLLVGVDSAVVIDAKGGVRQVRNIVGLNDMFGCVKLRVSWDKKIIPLPISSAGTSVGERLYMLSYNGNKSGIVKSMAVTAVDSVYSNAYFTLDVPVGDDCMGLPLLNDKGEVVAIMQHTASGDSINGFAVGATVIPGLCAGISNFGRGLFPGMAIRTALPLKKEDALPCLYMQGIAGDSLSYRKTVDDFIATFPSAYEGYVAKGEYMAVYCRDMHAADIAWNRAIELASNPADVYFSKAKTLFSIVQSGDSTSHPMLSVGNAFAAVDKAIEYDAQPLYINYKADMLLSSGHFVEAAASYESLASTNMRGPELFAKASQCYGSVKDYDKSIALLDSAVNCLGTSVGKAASPYILTRALVKMSAKKFRDAVRDYNTYEEVVGETLNANFYYLREQAEVKSRMFQQALNDIEMAIYLEPDNPAYYVEKGVLCYMVRMTDEGLRTITKAKELAPDAPDVYYIQGCLHMQNGDKVNARVNLEKALSLGHPNAEAKIKEL